MSWIEVFSHAWMRWISGSECRVMPISTVHLTVADVTRAWVSAENVLGITEDIAQRTSVQSARPCRLR